VTWWQKLIVDSLPILLGILAHALGVRAGNGKATPPTQGGGA